MGKAFIQESTLIDIADAIRSKNGSNDTYLPSEMADAISNILVAIEEKDVNFYDYEGTLLYSYTKTEALALTALPPLPDRTIENLTNEGWNWTLLEIKEQLNDVGGDVNVGCTYYTTDGKTHIFVDVTQELLDVPLRFKKNRSSDPDIIINWGDGNTTTVSETTNATYSHTYAQPCSVEITIENNFYTSDGTCLFSSEGYNKLIDVKRINFGNNYKGLALYLLRYCKLESISISIEHEGFFLSTFMHNCRNLKHFTIPRYNTSLGSKYLAGDVRARNKTISIPPTITEIKDYAFNNSSCVSFTLPKNTALSSSSVYCLTTLPLQSIHIPSGITLLPDYFLYNAFLLKKAILHEGLLTIGTSAFYYTQISTITIPSTVTSIGSSAFSKCYFLETIYCKAVTPPTIQSDTFPNSGSLAINTLCRFFVPRTSLAAYQSATNWSDWANNIYPYDF